MKGKVNLLLKANIRGVKIEKHFSSNTKLTKELERIQRSQKIATIKALKEKGYKIYKGFWAIPENETGVPLRASLKHNGKYKTIREVINIKPTSIEVLDLNDTIHG